MKKWFVIALLIFCGLLFFTIQETAESKRTVQDDSRMFAELVPKFVTAESFAISGRVSDLGPARPEVGITGKNRSQDGEGYREVPNGEPFRKQAPDVLHDIDTSIVNFGGGPMPLPSVSFDGLSSNDNAAAYGFRVLPPDTNGDVGPNHYVQAVNSLIRIFDKSGNPQTPPFKLSSIFSALGTPCSTRNDGDPIVLYDELADRWLISQFCTQFPPFRQMLAVSRSGDPTGSYFVYEFVMPNNKLNDYSKFGVWPDGYYMSTDEFFGSDYAGSGAFVFDRARILAGDPAASYIYFDLASPTTLRLGGLLPTDLDGLSPPPAGAPNIFVGYTATEYGDPLDAIRLFEFKADFVNPGNSTFSERPESPLAVGSFDPTSLEGRADIAQPIPGERLDSQSDRLMYRVSYRNFGSHESLLFNQTVRLTPPEQIYRAGVRVYELRKTGGSFSVTEQTTIGTTDDNRWMAAAGQDWQGNLAVGYNTSNEEKQPSIFYTGRTSAQPPGTFRPEAELVAGTGVQTAFGFRWGDYNALSIDPADGCTFWLTGQYYSLASQNESAFGWLTRIGRFKFPECVPAPIASFAVRVRNAADQSPIPNALVQIRSQVVPVPAPYTRYTQLDGQTGTMRIPPQNYTATVSAKGFRTKTVDFGLAGDPSGTVFALVVNLEPTAVLENNPTGITSESCVVNMAAEPGETLTLSVPLRNTGLVGTTNLTAELLPVGGVLNPSAPQSYGALAPGGNAVVRPFTFTINPNLSCGAKANLTFRLRDGMLDLGTISIELQTGVPRVAFREKFDSAVAPNLPAGWTTGATGGQQIWKTSGVRYQSRPQTVFSPDPREVGLNELVTPPFSISSPNAELSFQNWYELETTFLRNRLYDGSVLEIKIGGGNWQDILASGGSFLSGGYDGTIDSCCQNPLAGRLGWSGRSGINQVSEFITSRVKLPPAAAGQSVQLRWRVGTDIGTFREGQYLDDILVKDGFTCSCQITQKNRAPFDFDGDGRTDLSVFRPSDSANEPDFLWQNSGNGTFMDASWGSINDQAANADYDGDGRTDLAVFRPAGRTWFIFRSSDNTIVAANFGLAGDLLTPADYDADGRSDIAVFRPATGVWYVLRSSDGQVSIVQFGASGDLPVPADFDGDGRADQAVFRPSTGTWYVLRSTNGGASIIQFGLNGDRPVVGDFDGDAKADYAVFRPGDQTWYLLRSLQGFAAARFGLAGDRPLQADFDGDGRRDIAVFRPETRVWYYVQSSDGEIGVRQFGQSGDTAVPSIFVR